MATKLGIVKVILLMTLLFPSVPYKPKVFGHNGLGKLCSPRFSAAERHNNNILYVLTIYSICSVFEQLWEGFKVSLY